MKTTTVTLTSSESSLIAAALRVYAAQSESMKEMLAADDTAGREAMDELINDARDLAAKIKPPKKR